MHLSRRRTGRLIAEAWKEGSSSMVFEQIAEILLRPDQSLRDVLERFNQTASATGSSGFGIVVDSAGRGIGVVTDGDIRHALSDGCSLDAPVEVTMAREFCFLRAGDSMHTAIRCFEKGFHHLPVLDAQGRPEDLLLASNFTAHARTMSRVVRARAPVRISFCGGGTDMSYFFNEDTGYVLSATIDKFCHASVRVRDDGRIHLDNRDYQRRVFLEDLVNGEVDTDLLVACIRVMRPAFGFDLETFSDVPPGTGLGGSSAMAAAVAGALNYFRYEHQLDPYQLADLIYQAERVELGIPGGWQDQYASVFGGMNMMRFSPEGVLVSPLRISESILLELHYNLMLFRVGASRCSGDIIQDQGKRYEEHGDELKAAYRRMSSLALRCQEALLRGALQEFGRVLHEGWELKRSFSRRISNQKVDALYAAARGAGALGGKLLGAGASGYLLLFCPPARQAAVRDAMESKGAERQTFNFVPSGLQLWTAADGAQLCESGSADIEEAMQ
jgi:D-glycero-alpha-D-manno-heptose-7-phosphate kinase